MILTGSAHVALLSNAIKFTPTGGRIVVRATASSDAVRVDVADTGIGIAPDKLERIWERFYQVESSKSRRFGGTGLGLAIVRGLVGLMGGRVEASSAGLDQGATFSFTLPLASEAHRVAPREEPAPALRQPASGDPALPGSAHSPLS